MEQSLLYAGDYSIMMLNRILYFAWIAGNALKLPFLYVQNYGQMMATSMQIYFLF